MFKATVEALVPDLRACLKSSSTSQQLGLIAACGSRRTFAKNYVNFKKYTIKDETEFNEKVRKSIKPVIVDFHGDWCKPCETLTSHMSDILEHSDEMDLAIVDVMENEDLVKTFNIQLIPTVYAFRDGKIEGKFHGLIDDDVLDKFIYNFKNKNPQDPDISVKHW